jgi:hypothetical protein
VKRSSMNSSKSPQNMPAASRNPVPCQLGDYRDGNRIWRDFCHARPLEAGVGAGALTPLLVLVNDWSKLSRNAKNTSTA